MKIAFFFLPIYLLLAAPASALVFDLVPADLDSNADFYAAVDAGELTWVSYFDPQYYVSPNRSSVAFFVANLDPNELVLWVHGVHNPATIPGIMFDLPLQGGGYLTDVPESAIRHYPAGGAQVLSVLGDDLRIEGGIPNGATFRLIYSDGVNFFTDVDFFAQSVSTIYENTIIPNSMLCPEYRIPHDANTAAEPFLNPCPSVDVPQQSVIPETSTMTMLVLGMLGL
ncbi:MAG: hypothetical protein Q8R76_00330 [Candidatus Omnitrophota bacterium]|nr:hypothetical protein [Candidatus Omnitrophota bacterium]